ncbi:MAG TPA: helix-hairpin-helix domain-containing protein [Bacteroidales bacterium]|nr:helix-hairpin-helix domain-containing protein [Bacteroidales bacterium]HPR12992.1 helix-hairpin-helix domain-containing protein [Bacteroidales bacterium]HRW85351.1 helix-hairpin-helix domain-containing protein [Bacteroidales bacterium]
MKPVRKNKNPENLQSIPGIGRSIAEDLHSIGVHHVNDLKGQDPEALFSALCTEHNAKIDRCVLYTFRCAVYYAENEEHDPELLKWWNWKDRKIIVSKRK